jgi:hypothetical protein
MAVEVVTWWTMLGAVSVINVLAWSLSALALQRRRGALAADIYALRRLQLLLSAGYVFGCAFRTAFPVQDVQRLCLVDSWLSSVLVGRSVATVAELCFAAQCALLLRELAQVARGSLAKATWRAIVPLIVVAEVCSWHAVLSRSNLGHVVEESIWALTAAMAVATLLVIWRHCDAALRRLLLVGYVAGGGYIAFMWLVDVPMYWSRWVAETAAGRPVLAIADGFVDAAAPCIVNRHWHAWRSEVPWMSLYFSVPVWLSIAFVHLPALERRAARRDRAQVAVARAPG